MLAPAPRRLPLFEIVVEDEKLELLLLLLLYGGGAGVTEGLAVKGFWEPGVKVGSGSGVMLELFKKGLP
jgi:hypothetical protein